MNKSRAFISHISEEEAVAGRLKTELTRDFLGLMDVFVSSDTESIAAGEEWLESIDTALRECAMVVILCSPESIARPWINFEAGAAWMRNIPIIPVCHSGLSPRDLPMPLSLRQGIALTDSEGLKRLYKRVAEVLSCQPPVKDFRGFADQLRKLEANQVPKVSNALDTLKVDRATRDRLAESLLRASFRWRSLDRVAAESGLTLERAADLLRSDPEVRFSKGKSGQTIVGLKSRVGA